VQKHEEKLTGVWRQMSTLRRQYEKWCKGDDIRLRRGQVKADATTSMENIGEQVYV